MFKKLKPENKTIMSRITCTNCKNVVMIKNLPKVPTDKFLCLRCLKTKSVNCVKCSKSFFVSKNFEGVSPLCTGCRQSKPNKNQTWVNTAVKSVNPTYSKFKSEAEEMVKKEVITEKLRESMTDSSNDSDDDEFHNCE